MAYLMRDGTEGLAPHVASFAAVFGLVAGMIPVAHELFPVAVPYLPSATAFAIGMYIQVRLEGN